MNAPFPKPSRKGPWWALAISLYFTVMSFIDAFIDREDDAGTALAFLPAALICLILSWLWMEHRLAALERWKEDREFRWWLRDLPEED